MGRSTHWSQSLRTGGRVLAVVAVLAGLGAAAPAWSEPGRDAVVTRRAARIAYQRDRLSVQPVGERWYVVVDGYGRSLDARQLARALGDGATFDVAARAARQQSSLGAAATAGGPLLMLVGLNRVGQGDLAGSGFMRAAGYGTLVAGMAGTAGGIAMLADRRPRQPPTYYPREQAERLVAAYNQKLRDVWGITAEEASLVPRPPRPPIRARVSVSLAGVGVHGSF